MFKLFKNKSPDEDLGRKDYEKLGKLLVSLGQMGVTEDSRRKIYRMSFIIGVFRGLGSVIGATLVLALLLFILSVVGEIPLVGDIADTVRETINSPSN